MTYIDVSREAYETLAAAYAVGNDGTHTSALAPHSLRGQVTDCGDGSPTQGLGGRGTLRRATHARLAVLFPRGERLLLGRVAVARDGTFDLARAHDAADQGLLLAEVLDATDSVIGATLGSMSGRGAALAPVTSETSLHAHVVMQALHSAQHAPLAPAELAHDVAALLGGDLSAALGAALASGASWQRLVEALADACRAGHRARIEAQAAPHGHAPASLATSAAFASSLVARLGADPALEALVFTSLQAAATLEAEVVAQGVLAELESAGASATTLEAAADAGLALMTDVALALEAPELDLARARFGSSVAAVLRAHSYAA